MKSLKYLILILAGFMLAMPASGQTNAAIKRGDKHFKNLAYPKAIKAYTAGLKKTDDPKAKANLAHSYREIGNTYQAEYWYSMVANLPNPDKENVFWYARMLQSNGKYGQAENWFEKYTKVGGDLERGKRYARACENAMELKVDSTQYQITKLPFNSKESDFAAVPYDKGFVFSSARKRGFFTKVLNLRNENNFYDLYYASKEGGKDNVEKLKGKVNTRFHEGPAAFEDANTMYFTRSNYKRKDKSGIHRLELYSAKKDGKKWTNLNKLPFNDNQYSCGHAAVSKSGQYMVFASDIPGGFGGSDLYISKKEGDKWSTPLNLGSKVNTEGDELFPAFQGDNLLFFSSDGHIGLGGMDIFVAKKEAGAWGQVQNAGFPLNSSKDDFGISWIPGKAKGYFSSDRRGGMGEDDIYVFDRKLSIKVLVVDSRTKDPVEGAKATVMDVNNKKTMLKTDETGRFTTFADVGRDYFITVNKDEYLPSKERVSTKDRNPLNDIELVIEIERDLIFSALGTIKDSETGQPVSGADIEVIGEGLEDKASSGDDGKYFVKMEEEMDYTLIISKEGYMPHILNLTTRDVKGPKEFVNDVELKKGTYTLVSGKTVRKEDQSRLGAVNVFAINAGDQKEVSSTKSRTDGRFWMVLGPNAAQYVMGSKIDFFADREEIPAADSNATSQKVNVTLQLVKYEVGALVKSIYYDYRESNIRRDAGVDLFEIVYFLQDNPDASVELGSHTDCRGSNPYNQKLSESRAGEAVKFITSRGIDKKRITSKGYGETKLANRCKDGIKCSDEEHQMNRRSEIRITKVDPEASDGSHSNGGLKSKNTKEVKEGGLKSKNAKDVGLKKADEK